MASAHCVACAGSTGMAAALAMGPLSLGARGCARSASGMHTSEGFSSQ